MDFLQWLSICICGIFLQTQLEVTCDATVSPKISHKEPKIDADHTNLVVKWSDVDNSTFILAIGERKGEDEVHDSKLMVASHVDDSFAQITLHYPPTEDILADNLYLNGTRLILTDSKSHVVCSSLNYFASKASGVICSSVEFNPENIYFHPDLLNDVLVLEESTKKLYHSSDYGSTWDLVAEQVYKVYWENWSSKNAIYIKRKEATGNEDNPFSVIKSLDFFRSSVVVKTEVHEFQMETDFLFYSEFISVEDTSASGESKHVNVYVSKRDTDFKPVRFNGDADLDQKRRNIIEFFVADVSDDQVFMVLSTFYKFGQQNAEVDGPFFHDLYISDITGASMERSLVNISYISPSLYTNVNWEILRLSESRDNQADIYSVQGLKGVFIATQKVAGDLKDPLSVKYKTLITYNKGSVWEPLVITEDDKNKACTATNSNDDKECTIQLVQASLLREGLQQLSPVYSSSSAPGMIVGTGVIGEEIGLSTFTEVTYDEQGKKKNDDQTYMFISVNGGISFSVGLKGTWIYAFLDSGGFLTALDAYKPTQIIWYTYDHGNTWEYYQFSEHPVIVYHARSRYDEKTSILNVFCSHFNESTGKPEQLWNVIFVDFSKFFPKLCNLESDADYDLDWKVNEAGRSDLCILGREQIFIRRHPKAECMNGPNFSPLPESVPCMCTRRDYECDQATYFTPETQECKYMELQIAQTNAESQCVNGDIPGQVKTFIQSVGYRRVEGDECEPGAEALDKWEPKHRVCPIAPEHAFILLTDSDNIHRLNLEASNSIESKDEIIDVGQHRYLSAIAYSYPRNLLFFVDKPKEDSRMNMIKRLNLSGSGLAETIHEFAMDLIHDVCVDMRNDRLYWVEQNRNDFSHRIMSSALDGKMKRVVVNKTQLEAPKNMAVDSKHGYIFWMEWSNKPAIMRATLDGRNLLKVIDNDLFWSESLSPDLYTDDPKGWLYWVESFYGRVEKTHYDGSERSVVVALPSGSSISAVTAFKDYLFVANDKKNEVGRVNKNVISGSLDDTVQLSSDDTDVSSYSIQMYAYLEETHNVLSDLCGVNNGGCSHICLQLDQNTHVCLCPEGMEIERHNGGLNETCSCPGEEEMKNGVCTSGMCGASMFHCDNNVCIPRTWQCDHSDDCGDNSDEKQCQYEQCQNYEFECKLTKKCIPNIWRCDFDFDCGEKGSERDESDEEECQYPACAEGQFQCNTQKCIPSDWRCDRDQDCNDHSDEDNCVITLHSDNMEECTAGGFKCDRDRKCIPDQWKCDGNDDCDDGSDEKQCADKCDPQFQFDCKSTSTDEKPECVYRDKLCDETKQCTNGADEAEDLCQDRKFTTTPVPEYPTVDPTSGACLGDDIRCPHDTKCIPASWFCDHVADCKDRTDELDCDYTPQTNGYCPPDQFLCDSGFCINSEWSCDGTRDCTDGSDEKHCGDNNETDDCTGFSCFTDNKHYCFDPKVVCDGYQDCPDNSDEEYCGNPVTPDPGTNGVDEICQRNSDNKDQCVADSNCFMCDSGNQCIAKKRHCDHAYDCSDASDETKECDGKPHQCTDETFRCKTLQTECFPLKLVCDGTPQCQDKSDEDAVLCSASGIKSIMMSHIEANRAAANWDQIKDKTGVKLIWIKWRMLHKAKKTSSSNPGRWVKESISDLTSTNYQLTNLDPSAVYEVSAYVEFANKSTTENATVPRTFRTLESIPSKPEKVSVVEDRGSVSEAVVSWSEPSETNGEIDNYEIYYKCAETGLEQKVLVGADGTKQSFQQILKLNSTSDYLIQVAAINGAGKGPRSEAFKFKLDSIIGPSDFPKNVHIKSPAEDAIANEVTIQWEKVELHKVTPKYLIRMTMKSDTTSGREKVIITSPDATEYRIRDLSPGEQYSIEVSTLVDSEQSVRSEPLVFNTVGQRLPSISQLSCSLANNPRYESVRLSWNYTATEANYNITKFAIYYGLTTGELNMMSPIKADASKKGELSSKVISGLLRGTGYLFAVRVAGVGKATRWGPVSKTLRCATEFDPKMPPRNLQCVALPHSTEISFTWWAPKETMLNDYSYEIMGKSTLEDSTVQFRKYGDGISVNNATVKYSFSFDNPGINYTFFVSAKNASNFRLNDSKPVTCTIAKRGAPIVKEALKNENVITWAAPEVNNEPNEGYIVYGLEKAEDPKDKMTILGETSKDQAFLINFKYPKNKKINYVRIALSEYTLQGDLVGLVGVKGPQGELSPPYPIRDLQASSSTTFNELVHDRLFLKIFLPLVFVSLALFISVVMLLMRQRKMVNMPVIYNSGGGSVTILDNPDNSDASNVPYGRLQTSVNGDDYDDDDMIVRT
ncbi:sortilin-related receptor-like isoform X2 [Symsagittifera roscoffensis]|uniref:sortilin-related receptor-like isoform X2 n=1 Tax=Symsagittifera roscoffensis TaxID=84072 RepID=UPI00307B204B